MRSSSEAGASWARCCLRAWPGHSGLRVAQDTTTRRDDAGGSRSLVWSQRLVGLQHTQPHELCPRYAILSHPSQITELQIGVRRRRRSRAVQSTALSSSRPRLQRYFCASDRKQLYPSVNGDDVETTACLLPPPRYTYGCNAMFGQHGSRCCSATSPPHLILASPLQTLSSLSHIYSGLMPSVLQRLLLCLLRLPTQTLSFVHPTV